MTDEHLRFPSMWVPAKVKAVTMAGSDSATIIKSSFVN